MATITLTALPGHHEQTPGRPCTATVIEVLGTALGRTRVEAKTLDQIRAAVQAFGQGVAAQHPGQSFSVSIWIAKGSRKPNGFDAASRSNGLGQEAWMQTITKADPSAAGLAA